MGWDIPDEAICRGAREVRIAARCEIAGRDPLFVLDTAHCPLSIRATLETVERLWPGRRAVVIFSCLIDKNQRGMLAEFAAWPPLERLIYCPAPSPRACPSEALAQSCRELGLPFAAEASPEAAMARARAETAAGGRGALILATGSFYTAEPLRRAFARAVAPCPGGEKP